MKYMNITIEKNCKKPVPLKQFSCEQFSERLKVKSDHRSEFSNLSNWKEEGLQRDSNP